MFLDDYPRKCVCLVLNVAYNRPDDSVLSGLPLEGEAGVAAPYRLVISPFYHYTTRNMLEPAIGTLV